MDINIAKPTSSRLPPRLLAPQTDSLGGSAVQTSIRRSLHGLLLFGLLAGVTDQTAQAQLSRYNELANLPFTENRPTPETTKILSDELLFQRATQTYLWALPLINTLGMKVGSEKAFGAGYNVLPVWKKRLDAKTLVTTPLGAKAPPGKQANWLATVPGRGYFVILRLYGPTEAALDNSWKPSDVEKMQ